MSDIVTDLLARSSDDNGVGWTPNTVVHVPAGLLHHAADEIEALRAEVERLKIEHIQMQAALGYGIMAEDERHILPTNPFKCGTCDASKHLRAEVEKLRAALEEVRVLVFGANHSEARYPLARAALEERTTDDDASGS